MNEWPRTIIDGYEGPLICAAVPDKREVLFSNGIVLTEAAAHALHRCHKAVLRPLPMNPWPPFLPPVEAVRTTARSLYEALRELKGETT
jgi:hypothetical protein